MIDLAQRGVPLINPPEHGAVNQLKVLQLAAARRMGLSVPKTLVTNDPTRDRSLSTEIGEVVFKLSLGGGLCRPIDGAALEQLSQIIVAPVTFQERVRGRSVRATILGDRVLSRVQIPDETLDYRADEKCLKGEATYAPVAKPDSVRTRTLSLLRSCGLVFSGVDFIVRADGEWVFFEANSPPVYREIERKTRVPITQSIADYLLAGANGQERIEATGPSERRLRAFVAYAIPGYPKRTTENS